jgi:hypothetical protein
VAFIPHAHKSVQAQAHSGKECSLSGSVFATNQNDISSVAFFRIECAEAFV